MDFVCPKCRGALTELDRVKRCAAGHSFDRAREGYYNLLLSSGGGVHGDNREMVQARRDFLAKGYYRPMARRLSELVLAHTPKCGCVLDAGCGEGYYTDIVENELFLRDGESNLLAYDISKDAVRLASRKNRRVSFAVAGSYDMPVADAYVDTVINVFSPLALDEVRRVLKKGGTFLMVYPDAEHLFALKAAVYDKPYKNSPADTELDGFLHLDTARVEYTMDLCCKEDIRALFMMTPYAYRTGERERGRVQELSHLECEARFCIGVYRKI